MATGTLRRKEFDILTCLERSGNDKTQREIAAQCGISRSYVSRIEKKALKKLEEAMEGKNPQP